MDKEEAEAEFDVDDSLDIGGGCGVAFGFVDGGVGRFLLDDVDDGRLGEGLVLDELRKR